MKEGKNMFLWFKLFQTDKEDCHWKKKKKWQNVIVTVVEIFGYSIYQADPLAGSYLSSFKEQYAERDAELS